MLKAEADLLAAEREPGDVQFDEELGRGDTLAVERERDLALSANARMAVDEIDELLLATSFLVTFCSGLLFYYTTRGSDLLKAIRMPRARDVQEHGSRPALVP